MTSSREFKDSLNEEFARIGHALSSPKRLELLELLHQCDKSVDTLAGNSGMSVANTSRHLQILRAAGLVETQRDGVRIIYRLADEQVYALVQSLRKVAELHLAEVDRVVARMNAEAGDMEVVDRAKLVKLARAGEVTVLDVRPADEYKAAHLPHAISIPLDKLRNRLKELPADQQIVAYCRGPYCLLANEAVRILRSKGFRATRLGDGVAEWQTAGFPVARG